MAPGHNAETFSKTRQMSYAPYRMAVFKYSVRVPFWTYRSCIIMTLYPVSVAVSQNRDFLVDVVTRLQVG
jgi:hypothetical protein